MGTPESLHPSKPRAPGLFQWSVLGHVASGAPKPLPPSRGWGVDSPTLAAVGLSWEKRGKALRPEGRKSWEGGGYL